MKRFPPVCCFFSYPLQLLYFSAISTLTPWLQVQSKALCEQHRHIYSLPFTLAGLLPSPLLSPSSCSLSRLQLIPLSSPMVVSRQIHSQCAPDAPRTPPRPCSLSLLTPLFDTDRWNCYQYWLLSPCLPHSTLSILSSSFLSLTKWKISRESTSGKRKRETHSRWSQHMGQSPGFSWATFSVMFCPCRTLGCLHFYEMRFSWLHTASRRPRWNR